MSTMNTTHNVPEGTPKEEQSNTSNEKPDERLRECELKRDEYLAGWQRAKADFSNYKKEEAGRFEEVVTYSVESFIRELITVLDSFDLCIAALEKQGLAEKGVYMIRAQLEDVLKRRGVVRITVSSGDAFNPSVHEAVASVESSEPDGTVLEEVEAGYMLHAKVIRAARVRVAKGKEQIANGFNGFTTGSE